MAASLLLNSPSAQTVPRPKLVRDPLIRAGTKFLFDLGDNRCHPGKVITPGPLASGSGFTSLTTAVVQALASAAGMTINADGSLSLGAVGGGNGLRIGTAGQFDMSAAPYEYVACIWLKLPASGYTTTNFVGGLSFTASNANFTQVGLDMGGGGITPRAVVGLGTGSASVASPAAITPGTVFQMASHYTPGGNLEIFINGVVVAAYVGAPSVLQAAASAFYNVVSNLQAQVYRWWHCDIAGSIVAETAQGLGVSDILTAAQMISADYAFGRGTLVGAPKTAFA